MLAREYLIKRKKNKNNSDKVKFLQACKRE